MKFLSPIRYSFLACGVVAALAMMSSCRMSIDPLKASRRLEDSPMVSVFSHNSKHFANNRDCYEVGPLPERARRALITWLHNSVVKDMSYVYPQYYVTTYNARGGGEVVWGILSDGKGNMIGVLVPTDKRIPAWDMPSIGSHRVFVCETSAKKVLSDAIMEELAGARYDERRIESLKATGLDDPSYLISKPVAQEEQDKDKVEAEGGGQKEQGGGDAKKADDVQVSGPSDSAAKPESDTTSEEDEPLSPGGEEETSTDETEDTGDSSGDDSDTGSEESSGDEEGSTGEE